MLILALKSDTVNQKKYIDLRSDVPRKVYFYQEEREVIMWGMIVDFTMPEVKGGGMIEESILNIKAEAWPVKTCKARDVRINFLVCRNHLYIQ